MAWVLPAAVLGSAAIGGITSLLSGNKAASTAKETSAADLAFQKQLFNRQLMQQAPYSAAGYGALNDLATAYGQDLPKTFNPYATLGNEGAFGSPGGVSATNPTSGMTWQQFLSQLPGLTSKSSNTRQRGQTSTPATPATPTPQNFADGNALADYLMKYRSQIGSKDRAKFDQYLTQLRGMGAFPQTQQGTGQPGPVNPNTPQGLDARRTDFISRFKASPLYQMTYQPALEEGTKSLDRHATAAGLLNSGRSAKEMARFAGNLGQQTYGGYESGLWNMAGFGPGQTPSGAGVSNAIQSGANAGYAQAAGIQGVGNAVNNALGSYAYLQGMRSNSQYGS